MVVFRRIALVPLLLVSLVACGPAHKADKAAAAAPTSTAVSAGPAQPASTGTSVAPSVTAGTSPAALTGTQNAFLKSVDTTKRTITFDLVEFYTGAQAQAACKEDGVTETANDMCKAWYLRNNNRLLRTLPVKPDAKLFTIDMNDSAKPVPVDLAKFGEFLTTNSFPFEFDVVDGQITRAQAFCLP
ncbi:hypothetical protein GCM10017581_099090 [Dactylosporangium matsuzakiense]|uniref:Lipoprotein n=1 Tax=Dactylosporangium matsuzakiense TaxID=53360 RepID=A0A9W6KWU4_9ACTN|nr:hypothetical protein GCM10017581_099090 [Dactylosporangium matsuzakiense]